MSRAETPWFDSSVSASRRSPAGVSGGTRPSGGSTISDVWRETSRAGIQNWL